MWAQGGVTDEDKLSRAQARTVIGRVFKMASPFRKTMLIAFLCVCVTTLCALAGPLLVRRGIDQGIRAKNSDSLNISVALYLVVAVVAYVFAEKSASLWIFNEDSACHSSSLHRAQNVKHKKKSSFTITVEPLISTLSSAENSAFKYSGE